MYHQGTTSSHVTFFLEQTGELRIIILRRMEKSGLTAPHTNPHPHTTHLNLVQNLTLAD